MPCLLKFKMWANGIVVLTYMLIVWREYQKDNKFFILDLETEIKTDHKSLQGPQLLSSPLGTAGYGEESSVLPTESLQARKGARRKTVQVCPEKEKDVKMCDHFYIISRKLLPLAALCSTDLRLWVKTHFNRKAVINKDKTRHHKLPMPALLQILF